MNAELFNSLCIIPISLSSHRAATNQFDIDRLMIGKGIKNSDRLVTLAEYYSFIKLQVNRKL